jgi:hypothetical protein
MLLPLMSNKEVAGILQGSSALQHIDSNQRVEHDQGTAAVGTDSDEDDISWNVGFVPGVGPKTFKTKQKPLFPGDDVPLNPQGFGDRKRPTGGKPFGAGALPFMHGLSAEEQRLTQSNFVSALNSMNGLSGDLAQMNSSNLDNMMLRMAA